MKIKTLWLLDVLGFAGISQTAIVVMGGSPTVTYSGNAVTIQCGDRHDQNCAIIHFEEGEVTKSVGDRVYQGRHYSQAANFIYLEGNRIYAQIQEPPFISGGSF